MFLHLAKICFDFGATTEDTRIGVSLSASQCGSVPSQIAGFEFPTVIEHNPGHQIPIRHHSEMDSAQQHDAFRGRHRLASSLMPSQRRT